MHTDTDPAQLDGYQRLLAAVIGQAWRDAHGRNERERLHARAWLNGPGAEALCDWLGLPVDTLRRRVGCTNVARSTRVSAENSHMI